MSIPTAYKQVEYIETTGTQYINTGVIASEYPDPITYEMVCAVTGKSGSSKTDYYWGATDGSNRSGYLGLSTDSAHFDLYCGASDGYVKTCKSVTFHTALTFTVTASAASAKNATAHLNGTAFDAGSTASNGAQPAVSIWLFACNGISDTSGNRRFVGRCYGFTMTAADGTMIRDFVPCYRVADGVIGMYDTVGGGFYTNKGAGSFRLPPAEDDGTGGDTGGTGGDDTGDDTGGGGTSSGTGSGTGLLGYVYNQIEYLETDGYQYIDTGVKASDYPGPITYEFTCAITKRLGSGKIDYYWGATDGSNRSGYLGLSPSTPYRLDLYCGAGSGALKGYIGVPHDQENPQKITLKVVASAESASTATAYIDGVEFADGSTAKNGTQPTANIWLFACNGIDDSALSKKRRFKGRCYRFRMIDASGKTIRNFLPCYRVVDGEVGLFDTVGSVFYTNKGTKSFIRGADIGYEWYRIKTTTLTGIADAIRTRNGTTDNIDVANFANEILGNSGGSSFAGGLIEDKPTTPGQWACLSRASQMRDIKYTPKDTMYANDKSEILPKGVETSGIWYSSVRGTEWGFIGYHVSLYSWLTAVHNPESIIYKKTYADYFPEDTDDNGACNVYGTNCSEYVAYALGLPYLTVTNWLPKLECMVDENGDHDNTNYGGVCFDPGLPNPLDPTKTGATDTDKLRKELKLCDVLNAHSAYGGDWGHALLITGIRRDKDGYIQEVDVSDSWWPQIRVITYKSWEEFVDFHFGEHGCRVYRYDGLERVPFPENLSNIVYSDICTNRGDKISIRPDQDIALNVLNAAGYAGIVLFKDGESHITRASTADWELSGLTTGKYTAVLYKSSDDPSSMTLADATETNSTSFIVCNVTVTRAAIAGSTVKSNYTYTAEPIGGEYPVPVRVTIKKSTGITIDIHPLKGDGFAGSGEATIEIGSSFVKGGENQATIIHVPFKTEYGFVVAECAY